MHLACHVIDRSAWRTVTQQQQDEQDDQKRREALRDLVESWMDRLQLISVIVSGFVELPMLPNDCLIYRQPFLRRRKRACSRYRRLVQMAPLFAL